MPRKKRRRPTAARTAPPAAARAVAPAPEVVSARRPRSSFNTDPDTEPAWSRFGLFVLLGLVFILEVGIGAVSHVIGNRQHRLLLVDLFFFQAPFVLPACVILMPIAKYLTHQPRTLRFLESLSLGAVFALLSLVLVTVLVHPAVAGSVSNGQTDQYLDGLQTGDAAGILFADLLALLGSVQLFPGVVRMLGAPGRRARKRLLARGAAGAGPRSAAPRRPKATTRPKR